MRRDNYTVAVSTDGKSPLLAREIRKTISRSLPDYFDTAVGELGTIRERVLKQTSSPSERREIFSSLASRYVGKQKLRIGTRGSELAMIQTEMVIEKLSEIGVETEVVVIRSKGDRMNHKPLSEFGGKSVFVTDFEDAILKGMIDIAVHSAKDMPASCPDGVSILACLPRGDVRDVLISMKNRNPEKLHVIGTGSLRRNTQILQRYPHLECRPIRGNVPNRIHKLRAGEYDGVILAAAGIQRLQLDQEPDLQYLYLDAEEFIPAAGQAVIAVEGPDHGEIPVILNAINDQETWLALDAERQFMKKIRAGCHEAVGAWMHRSPDGRFLMHIMKQVDGRILRLKETADSDNGTELPVRLAERMLREESGWEKSIL